MFWAHYADSHQGICIEFNSTCLPINTSHKVEYSNLYPILTYPPSYNELDLIPFLIKSDSWKYENEYRSFVMENANSHLHDGESKYLDGTEITNIYLGENISDEAKSSLFEIINKRKETLFL